MFCEYNSIKNKHNIVDQIRKFDNLEEWVVMEKVHGSNLSFIVDNTNVKIASRTQLIDDKNSNQFFKVDKTFEFFIPIAQNIYNDLILLYGDLKQIIIYGELFGGVYSGMSTKYKRVQKDIFYSPNHHFYAFDILLCYPCESTNYVNYDECVQIFEKYNILYAKALFRGTFEDCIIWSQQHKEDITTIPDYFNLPTIDNNVREGHVIKPVISKLFSNGSRFIFKDKSKRFEEKHNKNKTEKSAGDKTKDKTKDTTTDKIKGELLSYVTEQRLDNVISKFGDITEITKDRGNIGLLIKAFIEDTIKDIKDDLDMEVKFINKIIQPKCSQMVLLLFKN